MNKTTLKILLGLLAFGLAGCAAFFSITGLSMLFAGATISVIVMASCLEFAKLVAASFLYQYWKTINKVLKLYLIFAVVILAGITSLGIYGFLSNAYQQTKIAYNISKTAVDSLVTQKSSFEFQVNNIQSQVDFKRNQLESFTNSSKNRDNLLTTLASQNKSVGSVERSAARTQKEISKINTEISNLMSEMRPLKDSVFKYDIEIKKVSLNTSQKSELGPLEYLSGILHVEMDKIVNWFILLFVIVFDPLAMALLIAFNFLSKKTTFEIKEEEPKKNLNNTIVESAIEPIIVNPVEEPINLFKSEFIVTESINLNTGSFIPENIVLDERIELPKEEINNIPDEDIKVIKQKDTPVIEYVPLTGDSIYEESNERKAEIEKSKQNSGPKPGINKRIGYAGGVS